MRICLILGAVACAAVPSLSAAAEGTVVALSPAEVVAAKEAGAQAHAESVALEPAPGRRRKIHGEVGFGIGTNGYRSVYGTAIIPVGDTGTVVVSVADTQINPVQRRR